MSPKEWYGWNGTILWIDLTKGKVTKQPLSKDTAYNFIGGRGLNIKALWDEIKLRIDPLSPENVLCLAAGPLTGTLINGTSRLHVSCLSPYSGILGDGSAGGHFAAWLKFAGYDQIIIAGRAEKPVYLWIEDDDVKLRDAEHLWGKNTWETEEIIRKDLGRDVQLACIGQAGEHLVRFASTIINKFRSAARGSGAVWGSKNLKAIAVRGTKGVKVADVDGLLDLAKQEREFFLSDEFHHEVYGKLGTPYGMLHWWPAWKNHQKSLAPHDIPHDITAEALVTHYEVKRSACFGCALYDSGYFEIKFGSYAETKGGKLDFETMSCCGTNCGLLKLEPMLKIDTLCDMYGLCTIPTGYVIGFAMELYEKGIINKENTDGMGLEWGNESVIIELIHKISNREGFGNLLAEGQYNLARIIGKEAMKYCYHVKGLSRGYHYAGACDVLYSTSTRGADHLRGDITNSDSPYNIRYLEELEKAGVIPTDIPEKAIYGQRIFTLSDILTRCKGGVYTWPQSHPLIWKYPLFEGPAKLLYLATGWEVTVDELIRITDRVYTLERAFNVREGINRRNDVPPKRAFEVGLVASEQHNEWLDKYYELRGWDRETGIPTKTTLEKLGMKYVVDELEANMPYPEWNGPPLWPPERYPRGKPPTGK